MSDNLTVEVSLRASHCDGREFSETITRSFNLGRCEFQEMQEALANLLLGFGKRANEARTKG